MFSPKNKCKKLIFFKNKRAFTLAEVLITLTILGVIAMLTVPNTIKSYQKTRTVTALKKIYSEIDRAMTISVIENGPATSWTGTEHEKIRKYIVPYFKVNEVITMPELLSKNDKYYQISGNIENELGVLRGLFDDNTLVLNLTNGIQVWVYMNSANSVTFYVDLNGINKPNTFGKDIFLFKYFSSINRFMTYTQCDGDTLEQALERHGKADILKNGTGCNKNSACNKNQKGIWCAGLIEASGWKMPKDYPW